MADEEMSNGEIKRSFAEIRRRLDKVVTTEAWEREIKHMVKTVEDAEKHGKERLDAVEKAIGARLDEMQEAFDDYRKARKITWDRVALWAAPVAALVAAVYTAWAATNGK